MCCAVIQDLNYILCMTVGERRTAPAPEAVLQLERLQARDGADRRQRGAREVVAAGQIQARQPRQPRQPLRTEAGGRYM